MKIKTAIIALATLLAVSPLAAAPEAATGAPAEAKGDGRVAETLSRLSLKYTLSSSGNFAVTYGLEGGRSQTVYVMSKTDAYNEVEIREIWSNAGSFDSEPESDTLMDLMGESAKNKLGCWALEKLEDGSFLLFYSIKFPAAASDEAYRAMLEFASSVTDAREKELFGSDEN
jgi:hypothetical protein